MADLALAHAADLLDPPAEDELDRAEWCRENLPHKFPVSFGPHHRWLFSRVGRRPRGVRAVAAAPRGSGKTTAAFVGIPLSSIALGTHRFIVISGVTQQEAEARLMLVRSELRRNRALVRRCPRLRFARPAVGEKIDRNKEILLVGGRIVAIGAGAAIRGILRETRTGELLRPDLFLGDDLETAESARSKLQTDRLEEWLFSDVGQLGANIASPFAARMDVIVIGTTLEPDALISRAIRKKGRFAAWQTAAFPAEVRGKDGERLASWPEGQPLELLDTLLDPTAETWIGHHTYAKEYLLDPQDRGDQIVKRAAILRGRVPRHQDGSVDLIFISHGIDPGASEEAQKANDPSALVSVGLDRLYRVWVFRAWRGHVSQSRLFDVAADCIRADRDSTIAFEAVAGFRWGVQEMRRRGLPNRSVAPSSDKVSRFQPVALLYEANVAGFPSIFHDESLEGSTFEEELLAFPTGEHDDYVDALWLAVKHATNDLRRRAQRPPA